MQIDIVSVETFAELGRVWRELELQAEASFFQSWPWLGCLAEERFPDPVLLRAHEAGQTLGLALFNRRRGVLSLHESGDPQLDAPFIEHNAPLVRRDRPEVAALLLRAAWRVKGTRRLRLSGTPGLPPPADGAVLRRQSRPAPWLDLSGLAPGADWLAGRSANTRQQIRRSDRALAASGPLRLARAATPDEAAGFLDGLIALHQASWQQRGQPGAFATDFLRRFHHALVQRALPRGELDLLRITAGETVVGYLYNLRHRGQVLSYQSGFAPSDLPAAKPGLTCHAQAIGAALRDGALAYDFLAGDHRYKRSLADRERLLWWSELLPPRSAVGLALRLLRRFRDP